MRNRRAADRTHRARACSTPARKNSKNGRDEATTGHFPTLLAQRTLQGAPSIPPLRVIPRAQSSAVVRRALEMGFARSMDAFLQNLGDLTQGGGELNAATLLFLACVLLVVALPCSILAILASRMGPPGNDPIPFTPSPDAPDAPKRPWKPNAKDKRLVDERLSQRRRRPATKAQMESATSQRCTHKLERLWLHRLASPAQRFTSYRQWHQRPDMLIAAVRMGKCPAEDS